MKGSLLKRNYVSTLLGKAHIAMLIANPGLLDITIFAQSFGRTAGQ